MGELEEGQRSSRRGREGRSSGAAAARAPGNARLVGNGDGDPHRRGAQELPRWLRGGGEEAMCRASREAQRRVEGAETNVGGLRAPFPFLVPLRPFYLALGPS